MTGYEVSGIVNETIAVYAPVVPRRREEIKGQTPTSRTGTWWWGDLMWWQGDVVTGWWGWQGDVVTGWGTHRLLWTPASGRPGPSHHLTALLEQSQVWPETWGWGGFGLKKSWKVEYWFQWRASSQGTGARVHSGFEEPNQVQWGWNQGGWGLKPAEHKDSTASQPLRTRHRCASWSRPSLSVWCVVGPQ